VNLTVDTTRDVQDQ